MIYLFPFLVVAIGIVSRVLMARSYRRSDRGVDLGEVFIVIILIYGLVPGIGFMLVEYNQGEINDGRLYGGYNLEQVEYVQLLFLLFIGSFVIGYAVLRNVVPGKFDHRQEAVSMVMPILSTAILLALLLTFISAVWGADIGDSYIDSYTRLRSAPVVIQQIAGVGTQLQMSLTIAAILLAVAAWPRKHHLVALALTVNIGMTMVAGGSRTNAFLGFLAYMAVGSIYVQSFTVRRAGLLAIPGLALFLFAGFLRAEETELDMLRFFFDSEFTAVFVTPLDLHIRYPTGFGENAPFSLYAVDILRFFPAQVLPFEKTDPGAWYANNFYWHYAARGGGFAFGIMAEIVLGLGIPEAIVRGLLLGGLFALLANWLHRPDATPLKLISYVWLIIISYQSYRDTTFSFAARAFFHLLPVLLLLYMVQSSRGRQPVRDVAVPHGGGPYNRARRVG
jgi:hypothetical protein